MRKLREVFQLIGGFARFVVLTILRCPFDAAFTLLQACFLQQSFDAVSRGDTAGLQCTCLQFFIGSMLLFLYNGTVWRVYACFAVRWAAALRAKLFDHLMHLPLSIIESRSGGEWFTRLNTDTAAACALFNQPMHVAHGAVAILSLLISSILLITVDPGVYVLILAFILPHAYINQTCVAKPMVSLGHYAQQAQAENAADFTSIISCADTAILYDAQAFLLKRFEESSLKTRMANMRMRRRSAFGAGLLPLFGLGGYLVLLITGGSQIRDGGITFGSLTAIFQYRGGLMAAVMTLLTCTININAATAGVQRVQETMGITKEG